MTGFDVPEQGLHMRLVGGLRSRGDAEPLPLYRGVLDTTLGPVPMEIVTDPHRTFPEGRLHRSNGIDLYGHGEHPAREIDEEEDEALRSVDAEPEIVIGVPAQPVELSPDADGAIRGVLRTGMGDWSAAMVDGALSLRIGEGRARD
jgi:hypothetical protein